MSDKRVYVVSTGSYDGYRVLCAAPDKKTAEKFVEKAGNDYYVEYIPVHEEYSETTEHSIQLAVSFDIDVEQETTHQVRHPVFDEQQRLKSLMSYAKYTRHFNGSATGYTIVVRGTDKELVSDAAYALVDILQSNPNLRHRASYALQPEFSKWKKERGI